MIKLSLKLLMPAFVLLVGLNCAAVAQDKLRIAGGLAGTWENSFSELGQNAGFFKKHGLVLEIFYTQGAGETQQAVISRGVRQQAAPRRPSSNTSVAASVDGARYLVES
jgi:ABC-type nitrate/sulfonate/bicarbonate transport system substrate-binding protein